MTDSKKKLTKKILKVFAISIIVYITISLVSTKIIYDSVFSRYTASNRKTFICGEHPADECRKEFSYPCQKHTLKGYHYSSSRKAQSLIVLVPGFRAECIEYEDVIHSLLKEGFDVFSFNPTGHGSSGGESCVGFPQIINDTNATLDFLASNENLFPYESVFLLGHSRGGYGVCCSANRYDIVDAVISINGTDTSMDAVMAYSTKYAGELAYANYPFLSMYQKILFGDKISQKSAVNEINKSNVPILIIQSANDKNIPRNKFSIYSHRDEITSPNAHFILYDKDGFDGHTSILYDGKKRANDDIIKHITDFFKETYNYEE